MDILSNNTLITPSLQSEICSPQTTFYTDQSMIDMVLSNDKVVLRKTPQSNRVKYLRLLL